MRDLRENIETFSVNKQQLAVVLAEKKLQLKDVKNERGKLSYESLE